MALVKSIIFRGGTGCQKLDWFSSSPVNLYHLCVFLMIVHDIDRQEALCTPLRGNEREQFVSRQHMVDFSHAFGYYNYGVSIFKSI